MSKTNPGESKPSTETILAHAESKQHKPVGTPPATNEEEALRSRSNLQGTSKEQESEELAEQLARPKHGMA